jgi:quercetin dioxygenase-like cupin family protein
MKPITSAGYPVAGPVPESFLFELLPAALSSVPFHQDTPAITRYFAERFPLFLGVHEVSPVAEPPAAYTQPHVHDDYDEVNIILSPDELVYRIQVGDETHLVRNNACVWIPRGTVHAANVLSGAGYYLAIRLN